MNRKKKFFNYFNFMANINYLLIENLINIDNIKNYFYIKHNYFSNSKNHKLPYITKNLLFIK